SLGERRRVLARLFYYKNKMKIEKFFDKLEDKIRNFLSLRPILYSIIGGVAIVIFWRGIWETADLWNIDPIASTIVSGLILLGTGLFVSFFVGDTILISGLRQEKKLTERAESEIKHELDYLKEIKEDIEEIKKKIDKFEK
ncbi:MAG: hypothetical protein ACD_5C00119G0001, partial [uncultured bacterium]